MPGLLKIGARKTAAGSRNWSKSGFCYKIQTEKAARGHNGSKIEEEGEDTEPSLLRVFVGAGELG